MNVCRERESSVQETTRCYTKKLRRFAIIRYLVFTYCLILNIRAFSSYESLHSRLYRSLTMVRQRDRRTSEVAVARNHSTLGMPRAKALTPVHERRNENSALSKLQYQPNKQHLYNLESDSPMRNHRVLNTPSHKFSKSRVLTYKHIWFPNT